MFITSKNKYLSNDMKIFGTCSIPLNIIFLLNYFSIFHWKSHEIKIDDWADEFSKYALGEMLSIICKYRLSKQKWQFQIKNKWLAYVQFIILDFIKDMF